MTSSDAVIRKLKRRLFTPLDLIQPGSFVEKVLALTLGSDRLLDREGPFFHEVLERFESFHAAKIRTVVFGGGSGLSSILGGDSRRAIWTERPFVGLKRLFDDITVAVCTTDDGGSTGRILRQLELIAVGDFRKVCLSMVRADRLERLHGLSGESARGLVAVLQQIMNHRFDPESTDREGLPALLDPLTLVLPPARPMCPPQVARFFRELGSSFHADPRLRSLHLKENCLGNLYLVASIYRESPNSAPVPDSRAILGGLQAFCDQIGAPGDRILPATTTPGQLRYLYGNGVMVYGQNKALTSRRGFPVERVSADYVRPRPHVSPKLLGAIRKADLILFAPGSIFSSLIPILQIESITGAIRENRDAVKVLAGNFWVQEGETDVTRRGPRARYNVSDMIEAYRQNVPGGVRDLFTQVLVADLKQLPGHVLRNYALEGKLPIFLDRERVNQMGFEPIEAPVFGREMLERQNILHHDPERFALAVKTLLFLRSFLKKPRHRAPARERVMAPRPGARRTSPAGHMREMVSRLEKLTLKPAALEEHVRDLLWKHRDILPEHLDQIKGIKVITAGRWKRSNAWDKVMGYFDPADRYVKIHQQLMRGDPERLSEDILIGIGEALLGRYFAEKVIEPVEVDHAPAGKIYSIRLAPVGRRHCFLDDSELRTWLELAGLKQSAANGDVYRILVNLGERFMPPGLLFGVLYAWYLDNRYGGLADHEMSLIRWKASELVPHQTQEMIRRRKRIAFLRTVVFRHTDPEVESILAAARRESRGG